MPKDQGIEHVTENIVTEKLPSPKKEKDEHRQSTAKDGGGQLHNNDTNNVASNNARFSSREEARRRRQEYKQRGKSSRSYKGDSRGGRAQANDSSRSPRVDPDGNSHNIFDRLHPDGRSDDDSADDVEPLELDPKKTNKVPIAPMVLPDDWTLRYRETTKFGLLVVPVSLLVYILCSIVLYFGPGDILGRLCLLLVRTLSLSVCIIYGLFNLLDRLNLLDPTFKDYVGISRLIIFTKTRNVCAIMGDARHQATRNVPIEYEPHLCELEHSASVGFNLTRKTRTILFSFELYCHLLQFKTVDFSKSPELIWDRITTQAYAPGYINIPRQSGINEQDICGNTALVAFYFFLLKRQERFEMGFHLPHPQVTDSSNSVTGLVRSSYQDLLH